MPETLSMASRQSRQHPEKLGHKEKNSIIDIKINSIWYQYQVQNSSNTSTGCCSIFFTWRYACMLNTTKHPKLMYNRISCCLKLSYHYQYQMLGGANIYLIGEHFSRNPVLDSIQGSAENVTSVKVPLS